MTQMNEVKDQNTSVAGEASPAQVPEGANEENYLVREVQLPNGKGTRLQYIDKATKKIIRDPKKATSPLERHMDRSQRFLNSKLRKLPAPVTVDDEIKHSLLEIVRAGKTEPKMSTAAVNAAKLLQTNAYGEAPKSELDRGASSLQ